MFKYKKGNLAKLFLFQKGRSYDPYDYSSHQPSKGKDRHLEIKGHSKNYSTPSACPPAGDQSAALSPHFYLPQSQSLPPHPGQCPSLSSSFGCLFWPTSPSCHFPMLSLCFFSFHSED